MRGLTPLLPGDGRRCEIEAPHSTEDDLTASLISCRDGPSEAGDALAAVESRSAVKALFLL